MSASLQFKRSTTVRGEEIVKRSMARRGRALVLFVCATVVGLLASIGVSSQSFIAAVPAPVAVQVAPQAQAADADCVFSRAISAPTYNKGNVVVKQRFDNTNYEMTPGSHRSLYNGVYTVYVPSGRDVEVKQAYTSNHLPYGPIIYNFTSTGWHTMPCKVGLSREFSYWEH